MRALVTGARGTVGGVLCAHLRAQGVEVVPWRREHVPLDDYWAMERFVRSVQPDVLFHLAIASRPTGRPDEGWLVNYTWPGELAWITRQLGVRFVLTSTAMVFSDHATGPFDLTSVPNADEGYGLQKLRAEHRVLHEQNPHGATVARLGWQIGPALQGNNMLAHFERQARDNGGLVTASRRWLPACAMVEDTVAALWRLATEHAPGLYMLDSNTRWSFFEIANALSAAHGQRWTVEPDDAFVYDQRLLDPRPQMPTLSLRLPGLGST